MAVFEIAEGAPGMGKSLYTARKTEILLRRNLRWEKKQAYEGKSPQI